MNQFAMQSDAGRRVRRIVGSKELQQITGNLSRFTINRLEQAGEFPKRFTLGGAKVFWDLDEVEDWLTRRRDEARQIAPESGA
jgi:prophage regulatory protein